MNSIKAWLKKSPSLVNAKRRFYAKFDYSVLDILSTFAAFAPNSAGRYRNRASLTIQAINQTMPFLSDLSTISNGHSISLEDIKTFPITLQQRAGASKLEQLLAGNGSDKHHHGYHFLYGAILCNSDQINNIFEIGLGTNNADVVSTMGPDGIPGASLRAFREFCPNANIFGADIDKRVLFFEDRIETFFMDQTDPTTFDDVHKRIPANFDLVIDDGLHSPNANIASLIFGIGIVKPGGWIVIEDIAQEAREVWEVVASILPSAVYKARIFRASSTLIFAVQRLV